MNSHDIRNKLDEEMPEYSRAILCQFAGPFFIYDIDKLPESNQIFNGDVVMTYPLRINCPFYGHELTAFVAKAPASSTIMLTVVDGDILHLPVVVTDGKCVMPNISVAPHVTYIPADLLNIALQHRDKWQRVNFN